MAWYAYCIAEKASFPELDHHRKPIPLPSKAGVLGNQVFLYPASDFAVVVSEHNPEESLTQKSAVDHARVIADCFQQATVLPFRFGTIFADDEALRRSVRSNQRQFSANVERLRGKTEMHLKVVLDDSGPNTPRYATSPCAGKEYLSRLRETATVQRERQTKAKAVYIQMHRMFTPLEEEITCRHTEKGKILLDIAHLIDHGSVARYQSKYSCAMQSMRDCQMALSGPWPPYHFIHHQQRTVGAVAHA